MKVVFRTINNDEFSMDLNEDWTVDEIKQQIAESHSEFSKENTKLICAGKLLDNGQHLKDLKLNANSFIVIINSKKMTARPVGATPVARPVATTSAATNLPTVNSPANGADLNAAGIGGSLAERGQIIQDIIDMGFDRQSVMLALRASFYNPDRAVEYLLSGNIPKGPSEDSPAEPDSEITSGVRQSSADVLQALRTQPQFQQLKEVIQQNPEMLPNVIEQIGQQHPELLEAIRSNEEEFLEMLTEETPPSTLPSNAQPPNDYIATVSLNPTERAAIDRLKELGFNETMCVQAYFACEKNENDAANFLFNANLDDDDAE